MPSSVVTPQLNETTAPYQFDGTVTMSGPTTLNGATTLNGTTTLAGPVVGGSVVNVANSAAALSPFTAADLGMKAWNFPTYLAQGTATYSVVGSVYLSRVNLTAAQTYSTIWVKLLAGSGTATLGSNFAGIYNSLGTLVATTADISTILGTAAGNTGNLSFPLATALTPAASAPYYVGMFFNASGTASFPVLTGMTGQTAANGTTLWAGTIQSFGPAAAPFPFSAIATTSGTAMPATFTLGSAGTTGAQVYWVGLS